ncbi:hypothetical protein [Fusobacterium ulcerans]|uniref:hypothetical protein n=1 Tax=Fusobacterium ulcerans TaxID=861 RepID=UPI002672DA5B|nr:hypothetical protein [Fusobacterium ulcerans]
MSITIDGIDTKVRTVEGTARATPIGMKNLDDRINALSGLGKCVKINIGKNIKTYTIPSQYTGWEVAILNIALDNVGRNSVSVEGTDYVGNTNGVKVIAYSGNSENGTVTRDGDKLTFNGWIASSGGCNILLYKL